MSKTYKYNTKDKTINLTDDFNDQLTLTDWGDGGFSLILRQDKSIVDYQGNITEEKIIEVDVLLEKEQTLELINFILNSVSYKLAKGLYGEVDE